MIGAVLVLLVSLFGSSLTAHAHQINLTNARLVVGPDRTVDVEVTMRGSDVDRAAGTWVFDDSTNLVQPVALAAASAPIVAYVEAHTAVLGGDGSSCHTGIGMSRQMATAWWSGFRGSAPESRIRCCTAQRC
jgi:hypothetical protein